MGPVGDKNPPSFFTVKFDNLRLQDLHNGRGELGKILGAGGGGDLVADTSGELRYVLIHVRYQSRLPPDHSRL